MAIECGEKRVHNSMDLGALVLTQTETGILTLEVWIWQYYVVAPAFVYQSIHSSSVHLYAIVYITVWMTKWIFISWGRTDYWNSINDLNFFQSRSHGKSPGIEVVGPRLMFCKKITSKMLKVSLSSFKQDICFDKYFSFFWKDFFLLLCSQR